MPGRRLARGGRRLAGSRIVRQGSIFAVSNVAVSALAAISSAVLARGLSTSQFGSYALTLSLLTFTVLFFEFGLFAPASRLAARAEGGSVREMIGASVLVFVPIALAFAGTMFALSFFIDGWFNVHAGEALRLVSPLVVAYPLSALVLQLALGVGRLEISSAGAVLTQVLMIALFIAGTAAYGHLTVFQALLARTVSFLVGTLVMLVWLRPLFQRVRGRVTTLVKETREYGFNIYVGRVLSVGTYNMDVLMLGIWSDAREVGLYALAGAIAYTVGLPATGLAAALFPRMSREGRLDGRWVLAAAGLGALGVVGVWLAAEPLIRIVVGARYADAAGLAVVLALAQAVRGVTAVYNQFMAATAMGAAMRNASLVLTISNIVLNFALIPPFGAIGAAWASVAALVANYIARVYYMRREMREQAERQPTASK